MTNHVRDTPNLALLGRCWRRRRVEALAKLNGLSQPTGRFEASATEASGGSPASHRHHIAVWLPRRFYAAVAATLVEMFEFVNTLRGQSVCTVEYLGASSAAVTETGIAFPTSPKPSRPVDILIVLAIPGMDRNELIADLDREYETVRSLLLQTQASGAAIAAHCSASWFLARAGMLDSREATASWWLRDDVMARFPKVRWDMSRLLIRDGNIYTSGGGFSGIEMGKALIKHMGFDDEERALRKFLVLPPTRHLQTPYEMPLDRLPAWSASWRERLASLGQQEVIGLSVAGLAERLAVSPRTMARRFAEEIGLTPKAWLTERRIHRAKHLLESTDMAIADVCHCAGYEDVPSFIRLFSRMTGMTPAAYRRQSR